jgi:hypothetical protein
MFFSEVVKALQWVTLKGLRDELDRRHPAWAADQADLDDALAGANFLSAAKTPTVTRCSRKSRCGARVILPSGRGRGDGALALHGFAGFAKHQAGLSSLERMRTRVTKKAWFGPKGLVGWGWNIVSWEGGLVTFLFLGLMVAYAVMLQGGSRIPVVVFLVLYLVVIVLTGDPPGPPKRRDDRDPIRERDR